MIELHKLTMLLDSYGVKYEWDDSGTVVIAYCEENSPTTAKLREFLKEKGVRINVGMV